MARNNDRDRGKPKVCVFCRDHVTWVDYKDVNVLRRFISDRAKIKARRTTGTCTQHQREVAVAIKTARELALLPYTQRTVSDKAGRDGRGGRGAPRGPRPDAARDTESETESPSADTEAEAGGGTDDAAADDEAVPAYSG